MFADINVCKVVGSIMKTMLGPRSLDKLIVEEDGHVLITNDGATAISSLVSFINSGCD